MKRRLLICASLLLMTQRMPAQSSQRDDLSERVRTLSSTVETMQDRLEHSQQEIDALREEVRMLRSALNDRDALNSASESGSARLQAAVSGLQDQQQVLQSEIQQHEQTKLETASKYPVKVTGMLLFSSFLNNGTVDNIDDPLVAYSHAPGTTGGSLAATARQSILGLDAFGPRLWGAKSSADVSIDFFGGLGYSGYNSSAGVVRLRTAHARLEWLRHSFGFAFDTPLISPLSPSSFAGVGEPALAWSGNLWTWSPQIEVRNQAGLHGGTLHYDFGLIDASAPGPPPSYGPRQPDAGEQSKQPGYEFRGSYSVPLGGRDLEVGAGGYYSRQAYSAHRHVDAWTGSVDWLLPLGARWQFTGEFYRGRAVGGLGGGGFKDIVTDPVTYAVRGLESEGGWAQVKLRLANDLEANAAFGQDNPFAAQLHSTMESASTDAYSALARNRSVTANFIYRPKTYLLFTTEFRYLQTWPVTGKVNSAPVVGFGAGYLF